MLNFKLAYYLLFNAPAIEKTQVFIFLNTTKSHQVI